MILFILKAIMAKSLNKVLKMFRAENTSKIVPPRLLMKREIASMTLIAELLKPLASYTDLLQGNGVTSSLAIGGFCLAVEGKIYELLCNVVSSFVLLFQK